MTLGLAKQQAKRFSQINLGRTLNRRNHDPMDKRLHDADLAHVELEQLIQLFFEDEIQLGHFEEVVADDVPQPSRSLLNHDQHMTVTVEKHYETSVDVKVLQTRTEGDHYSRKSLLTKHSDGGVVQYGIVRINKSYLTPVVREEIETKETPLGRVLINHNVLRKVKLLSLLKIECGPELAREFGFEIGQTCYGRTALIFCDGSPAIELLEIVS
jgi:chorismate-pyruvate lyase